MLRHMRREGSSQSVPYGWPPRRAVGGGASARCMGASVRGAGSSSKRWSKLAAHASRLVRKSGRPNSLLTVAAMEVPSYCESLNGFALASGSDTTVPLRSQGDTRMTGTRDPRRVYGRWPRGSEPSHVE